MSNLSIKALEERISFLGKIIAALPAYVYWKDKNGVYLGGNDAEATSIGLKNNRDLIGKTDFDLFEKEHAEIYRKDDQKVMETGCAMRFEEPCLVDGEVITSISHKTPLKDDQGQVIGILGVSCDIHQLKQAQKQLQTEKDQLNIFKHIIAHTPEYIYWKDRQGVTLGCNDQLAKVLGLSSPDEVIGKTCFDFFSEEDAKECMADDLEVINSGQPKIVENTAVTHGQKMVFLSHKVPLRDNQNQIIGLLGISVDITQHKQDEENLRLAREQKELAEASCKAKTQFLENMRHDVCTPLSGMIGFAENIKHETDNSKIHEYADNLKASGQALLNLFTEILDTIKFSSGNIPLLKKNFSLKAELINIIQLYQPKAKEKHLKLSLAYDDRIPRRLLGDPMRVHRMMSELVANALNFTHQGYVKVKALLSESGDRTCAIKLIVEDSGIGIPLDQQQKLFMRFNRLIPSCDGTCRGAGLGLSLVKHFIDELEGEIYVKSQPKQGSEFICVIPFREALLSDIEDNNPACSQKESPLFMTNHQPEEAKSHEVVSFIYPSILSNILLVEDNAFSIKISKVMLTELGCKVDVAPDGKTAMKLFQQNRYDLIFMDIGLPDQNGYEITKKMRLLETNKEQPVPIVALSTHENIDHKKRCMAMGMNAVLLKPLSKEQARDILNAFIPERGVTTSDKTDLSQEDQIKAWLDPIIAKCYDDTYIRTELGYTGQQLREFLEIWLESVEEDLPQFKKAYTRSKFQELQKLVHKMKGGAMYCGVTRFQEACNRLEKYLDGKNRDLVSELYNLVLQESEAAKDIVKKIIIEDTMKQI